jgi:anti-sigma factor RsiW
MRINISNRDWELLSAYMDGQLSSSKRVQLESRMQTNPELRAALDELTQTRAMLRSLPRLKAPHSFKLTPEMVGQRQPRRLYPFFQFASALSSLMLVLVLLSDFLGFGLSAPLGRMASQAPEAPVAAEVFVESAPESLAMEMPAEEPIDAAKAVPDEQARMVETEELLALLAQGTPFPEPAAGAEAEAYLAAPVAPQEDAPNLMMEATEAPADVSVAGDVLAEMPPLAQPAPEAEADQASAAVDRASPGFSSIRILQITLALVAVVTAFVALYLRRIGG